MERTVECDRHLSISLQDEDEISSTKYHLIAVSHHLGQSLSKGHYTATLIDPRRNRNSMWRYNDVSVSKTRNLDEQTAYILFYRKEKGPG